MDKIIVDTSVWVDFLHRRLTLATATFLNKKIVEESVGLTDVIRHELLVGATSSKDYDFLKRLLRPIEVFHIAPEDFPEFDEFGWNLWRIGLGGKYTDTSIAFLCHRHRLPLLSFDGYFRKLGKKGILKTIRG